MKTVPMYIVMFVVLLSVNIGISHHMHHRFVKDRKITVILQEFALLNAVEGDIDTYLDPGVKDRRVAVLKAFFRKYESPLYDHAGYIVKVSDAYGVDYRLLPAIAMQESTACKFIPPGSHNCWGWGIYGTRVTRFASYPEAIETIARGIRTGYIDRGLTTPEQIMAKYTPSSNGSWARGVSTVLGVLE